MSEYAPLRDAFNELNHLLIDKQQWDANHELRVQEQGLQKMQLESSLEDAKLRRTGLQLQSERDKEAMAPTALNIWELGIPNNSYTQNVLFGENGAAEKAASQIAGKPVKVDPTTGMASDSNGEFVRIPKAILQEKMLYALPLLDSQLNQEEMQKQNLSFITSKETELQKNLDQVPMSDVARRRALTEQLTEVKNSKNQTLKRLTPESLEMELTKRTQVYDGLRLRAAAGGADVRTLAALQDISTNAHADLRKVQAQIESATQRVSDRQLKRELLKEEYGFKLEIEQLKEKNKAKGEKSQQHYVIKVDKDNNPIPGTMDVLNVSKETGALEPPPPGYVYLKDIEAQHEIKKNKTNPDVNGSTLVTEISKGFQRAVPNGPMGATQYTTLPADQPRIQAALRIAKEEFGTYKNQVEAVEVPMAKVRNAEIAFQDELKQRVSILVKEGVLDPKAPTFKEGVQRLSRMMADERDKNDKTDRSFFDQYGYIPNYEDAKSLDPSFIPEGIEPRQGENQ